MIKIRRLNFPQPPYLGVDHSATGKSGAEFSSVGGKSASASIGVFCCAAGINWSRTELPEDF
jgi:hypothetical protein